jgi:hypothetical protein
VLSAKESERLEVFQMKCLRGVLGITKFDHKRNEDIRAETEQCTVGELVTRSRLRWLGHVTRMAEGRLPPRLLFGKIDGTCKRGRPVGRWRDMIDADLKKRKVKSWYNIVQDRVAWRKVVHGEVSAKIRGKRRKKEDEKNDVVVSSKVIGREGLFCPKCGKEYHSNKGGWFKKHVASCLVIDDSVSERKEENAEMGDGKMVVNVEGLKCPYCKKHYKSKAGGWYQKHVDVCGSSQSSSLG